MKNSLNVWVAWLATQVAGMAATSLVTSSGDTVVFGDWSKPATVMARAPAGDVPLVQRICVATERGRGGDVDRSINFLLDPSLGQVWIGGAAEQYYVAGGRI